MEIQKVKEVPPVERAGGLHENTKAVVEALRDLAVGQTVCLSLTAEDETKSTHGRASSAVRHLESNSEMKFAIANRKGDSYITRTA